MTDIGIMIGVGAPTSLAIDLANKFDITLIGFVKRDSFNIYTNNKKSYCETKIIREKGICVKKHK